MTREAAPEGFTIGAWNSTQGIRRIRRGCVFGIMELILASKSPRRRQLLEQMGLQFRVLTAQTDESMDPAKPVEQEIGRVSRLKAEAVRAQAGADDLIIAADTLVCIDGERLGKPGTEQEACAMLRRLSGRDHLVMTGVSVLCGQRTETFTETTQIHFRDLTDAEIQAYVATGEPMDKAGAYGIQGLAGLFVSAMHGDYYNVMGLPICRLTQVLRSFGIPVLGQGAAETD